MILKLQLAWKELLIRLLKKDKDMRILAVFTILVLTGCGSDDSPPATTEQPPEAVVPTTSLAITVTNNIDQTIFGVGHTTRNGVDTLPFSSNILPGFTGAINIDVTDTCRYEDDYGASTLWLIYNLGGGNVFYDMGAIDGLSYTCPTQVDITCDVDFSPPGGLTNYTLTCVGGLNN